MRALVLLLVASGAFAQAPSTYEPVPFQQGKDVVWVPTPQILVDTMLDMAKVTKDDFVMDLGSGDGRTVISAARRGASALGVEYDPDLVELSKRAAEKEGVAGKASFVKADLFETDFSQASVITMFLLPAINVKLRPKLLDLKPGTRIVSNTFDMGDWKPDATTTLTSAQGCSSTYCTAHLWIVPAKVAGNYKHAMGNLILLQQFQMLTGFLNVENRKLELIGEVRGEEIHFIADSLEYSGKVNGEVLDLH